jgi:multidrug efflux pump subunit AcrB
MAEQRRIEQQKQIDHEMAKQRIIEQQSESNINRRMNLSANDNKVPPKEAAPSKSNINSILNKLKQNLPKNSETSSVTEENSSDRRVLMTSTVNSDKRENMKSSTKGKKSVLNIRR